MFFTPGICFNRLPSAWLIGCLDTEDYFHRKRLPAEVVEADLKETSMAEGAKERLEEGRAKIMYLGL